MMYYYDGFYPMHGFGAYGIFGLIIMIIFWALIVALIVGLVRAARGRGYWHRYWDETDKPGRAIEILKERYAKGELSKEQFEHMKKDLEV